MSFIKICGVTRDEDLDLVLSSGATAVGFNLWPGSPRVIDEAQAQALCQRAAGKVETVLVVVNHPEPEALRQRVGADWVQLHGDETVVGPQAFKAVGIAHPDDAERALRYGGDRILVDARDDVLKGGTGRAAPPELARRVALERRTILAGGLNPETVTDAIAAVEPWGVDTASGVESSPGVKDPERVHRFVAAARAAFARES